MKTRTTLAVLALLTPATLALARQDEEALESIEPISMAFDWPADGSVMVESEVEKKGLVSSQRYALAWEPAEGGSRFSLNDFEFLSLEGPGTENPMAKAMAMRTLELVPDWLVNDEGGWGGTIDFDYEALVEAMTPLPESASDEAHRVIEQTRATMLSPAMRQQTMAGFSADWSLWVGMWLELAVPPAGYLFTLDTTLPFMGLEVHAPVVVENLRRFEHRGVECVELTYEQHLAGDAFTEAIEAYMRTAGIDQMPQGFIESMERTYSIRAIVEPHTLRPHEVWMRMEITLTQGEREQGRLDTKHMRFDWEDLERE